MFLGFYNYTVYLTYLNALTGFFGIYIILDDSNNLNPITYASICLLLSGIFDMLDGFVSNLKKKRSIEEKKYGIQIDSLADIISFGILPILIEFKMLKNIANFKHNKIFSFLFLISSIVYILAVLIRLAYFNVLAEKKINCKTPKENIKNFIGLPVTLASIIFPFLILSQNVILSFDNGFFKEQIKQFFYFIYLFFIILCSFLFVFNKIKFKKPKNIIFLIFSFLLFLLLILTLIKTNIN